MMCIAIILRLLHRAQLPFASTGTESGEGLRRLSAAHGNCQFGAGGRHPSSLPARDGNGRRMYGARYLEQQLPDLANEVAAHGGKRGIVSHHQLEHVAYLIPQRIVNVWGCKGFAEYVQLLERLPALSQKFRAIQAVELLSSLLEALCCMVSRPHSNFLKHRIGLPDKMFFRVVDIGIEEVTTLRLAEGLEFHP